MHVEGTLDIETAPQLERALCEPQLQTHLVVLDMGELSFMGMSRSFRAARRLSRPA